MGLAVKMARQVWIRAHRRPELTDLCQAAMVGLCDAAHLYDPSRGVKFSSYASRACYFSALNEVANNGLIGTPSWMNTIAKRSHPLLAKAARARFPVQFMVDYHDHADVIPSASDDRQDTDLMLATISGRDRMIVWRWMCGETYVAIGRAFRMRDDAVKQRVYRALEKIRRQFGGRIP